MINSFSRLNIKHRIFLSFGLIVTISILFTVFNILTLRQFHDQFTEFKQVTDDANLMLNIDNDLTELRRLILIFSHNDQVASIDDLQSVHGKMVVGINQLLEKNAFKKQSDIDNLKKMQASIDSFSEQFDNLEKQRKLRDNYINIKLINGYTGTNAAMTLLSSEVGVQQDKLLIKNLWDAQLAISKAESISADYFNTRQFQKKESVQKHLSDAVIKLNVALTQSKDHRIKQDVNKTIVSLKDVMTSFNQAQQADRNYLFLLNIVIAGESAELSILSEALKKQSLAEEHQLYEDVEEKLLRSNLIAILISVFGIAMAVIIAVMLANFIGRPLTLITETFMRLIDGKPIGHVPGVDRNDEIGQLARSADIFNDVNEATNQLLTESEALTSVLASRERELEKKNEDLTDFTRIASHDLKSPIQGIADLALWIEEDLGDDIPEDVKGNLNKIGVRVARMQNLIDCLLQYSKAGNVTGKVSDVNVSELIQETLDIVAVPPEMELNIYNDMAIIEAIKAPLQTVLRNLLANAIKHHSKTDGHINIYFSENESNYILAVEDDGSGIPEEEQKSIFELFRTAHKGEKSTGMGLAFCKRMVEANGGQIEVESSVGEGATFRVFWPKIQIEYHI